MAFPRSFHSETWFLRLPTGEVELTEPGALERAFRCGLVDARTPVRSVSANHWTTLGEAADLPRAVTAATAAVPSLPPASDLADGARWHVRGNDPDPEPVAFLGALRKRSSLGTKVFAFVLGASSLAFGAFGVAHADGADVTDYVMPADPIVRMDARLVRKLQSERETRELPYHSARDLDRVTNEQMRRMRDVDYARRMRGEDKREAQARAAGKPMVTPFGSPFFDPFADARNPFDR